MCCFTLSSEIVMAQGCFEVTSRGTRSMFLLLLLWFSSHHLRHFLGIGLIDTSSYSLGLGLFLS